jgi:hypothetical protein
MSKGLVGLLALWMPLSNGCLKEISKIVLKIEAARLAAGKSPPLCYIASRERSFYPIGLTHPGCGAEIDMQPSRSARKDAFICAE